MLNPGLMSVLGQCSRAELTRRHTESTKEARALKEARYLVHQITEIPVEALLQCEIQHYSHYLKNSERVSNHQDTGSYPGHWIMDSESRTMDLGSSNCI